MIVDGYRVPDFVIVGAMKCGTTSMFWRLCANPGLYLPVHECHFFDQHYWEGVEYYSGLFDGAGDGVLLGDKTPSYMVYPVFVRRLDGLLPGVKIIVMLRDPVFRAFSHWNMIRRDCMSFGECVGQDMGRICDPGKWRLGNVVLLGMYVDQVRLLFEVFGRDRVHVVISERFLACGEGVLAGVCDFLGVGGACGVDNCRISAYDGAMGRGVRELLAGFYGPLNEELFELLGYKVGEWL